MLFRGNYRAFARRSFSLARICLVSSGPKLGETFGEAKERESKPQTETEGEQETVDLLDIITKKSNKKYNDFYTEFPSPETGASQMTSFEEQKSFHRIFNYLKHDHGSIGITETLKNITGFSDADIRRSKLIGDEGFRLPSEKSAAIKNSFEEKVGLNHRILESILPTLEYVNKECKDSEQLCEFVRQSVLQHFLDSKDSSTKHTMAQISAQSVETPSQPLVDKQTLPVLLKFCLNSLADDFNSFDDTLLLINYIKQHQSIQLYEFGLNIDVYNALLKQAWEKTENLQLVSRLVDELNVNAIKPDLLTYKILGTIYLKCMSATDTRQAEPYLLWGNSADIHKIKHFIENIKVPN